MKRFFDPVTILLLLFLAYSSLTGGKFDSPLDWLMETLLFLPGILIALSFHEFAHAVVAYKSGDHTPKLQGRVTLNPVAHIDPFGFLCILFIGFGWGKPVMVDPRNFKSRKRDDILVSLAGVTMNLLLAIVFAIVFTILAKTAPGFLNFSSIGETINIIIHYIISINLILMVFNLLPIPPLDGFNLVSEILNIKYTETYYKIYQNGMWILMGLILLSNMTSVNVLGVIFGHTAAPLFYFLTHLYLW
ncbi:MAG: site-2 protease family protein [Clostridiales bacterium]|nr:site-2 protease family protein [Clostridiales bacterium]